MCKKCGKPIVIESIYRTTVCPDCGAELHSCVNCKFYSPGRHFDCGETVDELVSDKERANFCGSFSVSRNPAPVSEKESDARSAFQSLFGN